MLRSEALRQLDVMLFQCAFCNQSYHHSRILVSTRPIQSPTKPAQSISQLADNSEINIKLQTSQARESENKQKQQDRNQPIGQIEHAKQEKTQVQQKQYQQQCNKASKQPITIPISIPNTICIACYTCPINFPYTSPSSSSVIPLSEISKKIIDTIPLPQYKIVEDCLKLVKQMEDKTKQIINNINKILDDVQFFVFGLAAQVRRLCHDYTSKVSELGSRLRVEDWVQVIRQKCGYYDAQDCEKTKEQIKKLQQTLSINQLQLLLQMQNSHNKLSTTLKNLQTLTLHPPTLTPAPAQKRSRKKLSQIPISCLINFKNTPYYGLSDGRILIQKYSGIQEYKAHDSLIRSFTHNNQFILYSGSDDFTIKAWDVTHGLVCLKVFGLLGDGCKSYHRGICLLDHRGKQMMLSTRGKFDRFCIRVWELQGDYQNIGALDGHFSFIRALTIVDKQKSLILTASEDKTLRLWHPSTASPLLTLPRQRKPLSIIASPPELSLVCLTQQQNKLTLLSTPDLTCLLTITLPRKILCSSGYSNSNSKKYSSHVQNDYFIICIPGSIAVYDWSFRKVWNVDVQLTWVPVQVVQLGNGMLVVDGSGIVEELIVGQLEVETDLHNAMR